MKKYRIGIGYDIHRFKEGRDLVLGGVTIPYKSGLDGHSDADVLLHAVCDAILGALGLGDIGEHFPNSDDAYKGMASVKLLEKVIHLAGKNGFKVVNLDCVLQAEEPNFKEYKPQMRMKIAAAAGIDRSDVNIKATTQERLGAIGNKEGIAAFASVLLGPKGE
jgi:2-C-methyl-D-erythritol 2,4-cyclodiphosphate synthase